MLPAVIILYVFVPLNMGWQIPSAKFLLDFAKLHRRKSIIIYPPHNSEKSMPELYKK